MFWRLSPYPQNQTDCYAEDITKQIKRLTTYTRWTKFGIVLDESFFEGNSINLFFKFEHVLKLWNLEEMIRKFDQQKSKRNFACMRVCMCIQYVYSYVCIMMCLYIYLPGVISTIQTYSLIILKAKIVPKVYALYTL